MLFLDPIAGVTNQLIFFQLHHLCIDLAYVILFIHSIRLIWLKPPKIVWVIGLGWYFFLFFLTLSWTIFTLPNSSPELFSFLNLPHSYSTYFNEGAGLRINGIIIYSTGFRYLGELYRIFCLLFSLYAYYNLQLLDIKEFSLQLQKIKRLWISVWILMLIQALTLFPWFFFLNFLSISLLVAGCIIFYIALFAPEGLVISQVQFIRVSELFAKIKRSNVEINIKLSEYIDSIPESYWNELVKIQNSFTNHKDNN